MGFWDGPLGSSKNKVYVRAQVIFETDGRIMPGGFWWEDGTFYEIDKVLDVRRAASLKAGGAGIRYTCKVRGKRTYLYLEEDKWFMERK